MTSGVGVDTRLFIERALGALCALSGIVAAVLTAYGLGDLVGARRSQALWLIAVALVVRGAVSLVSSQIIDARERSLRRRAHVASVHRFARATAQDLHHLDTAIEQISAQSSLSWIESATATVLTGVGVVAYYGGVWSVVIVVGLIGLSIPVYVRVGRHSVAMMEDFHHRRTSLVARQLAVLRAITDLRALGAVQFGADTIAAESTAENRAVLNGIAVTIRSTLVTEFLGGVSVGLVAMVVGLRLWHHDIALVPALAAVLVTVEIFSWLRRYGAEFHRRDDANNARSLLAQPHEVSLSPSGDAMVWAHEVQTAAGAEPVSFSLGAGERIVVKGRSGVGKSSLLETVVGLREPVAGTVARANVRVGFVRPDCHFLSGSLRENLTLGANVDDATLRAALLEVNLRDERFSNLDVDLGEDARSLSTGERTLVCVARALVADVTLLVIDDVTGVLDTGAREVLRSLLVRRGELAVLEAVHENPLVEHADVIIEMRNDG